MILDHGHSDSPAAGTALLSWVRSLQCNLTQTDILFSSFVPQEQLRPSVSIRKCLSSPSMAAVLLKGAAGKESS